MSVAGIICEYNPFHNGHAYQINQLKTQFNVKAVVCAMSGHFMQRGEPALLHKLDRTKMALASGADLVIELPAIFATRSAYWFALGGVTLLANTGIVTHLSFGAESANLNALQNTAKILARPSPQFQEALNLRLKEGLSYVSAQAQALLDLKDEANPALVPNQPNDRLALAYLQIIEERKLSLQPLLISRYGAKYHQLTPEHDTNIASANSIRNMLDTPNSANTALQSIKPFLPDQSYTIINKLLLQQIIAQDTFSSKLIFPKDLNSILMQLLRRATIADLRSLPDMTEGLENRIYDCASKALSLEDFYSLLKTKRYSLTRLQRAVLHLYLNYSNELASEINQGTPYIRILGFNNLGQKLLAHMKKHSSIPIISRSGQLNRLSHQNKAAKNAWELEIRSGNLYALLQETPTKESLEYNWQPLHLT